MGEREENRKNWRERNGDVMREREMKKLKEMEGT